MDQSLNGYGVFYDLCLSEKARCRNVSHLSPGCKKYDCILWFCKENRLPETETLDWFEDWLQEHPGKTLAFIGRTYEADLSFWNEVRSSATESSQSTRVRKKIREAETRFQGNFRSKRFSFSPDESETSDDSWFQLTDFDSVFRTETLQGEEKFHSGIAPERLEIVMYGGIEPQGDDWNVLLRANGRCEESNPEENGPETEESEERAPEEKRSEILIAEKKIGNSRLLLVPNGSFLFNYPLINHENRKLAFRFLKELDVEKKRVLFLNAGARVPTRSATARPGNSALLLLQIWPLALIFWQLIFLGIIICFWKWPMFGKVRELPSQSTADFSTHIAAYAQLLNHPGNVHYAKEQIRQFQDSEKS